MCGSRECFRTLKFFPPGFNKIVRQLGGRSQFLADAWSRVFPASSAKICCGFSCLLPSFVLRKQFWVGQCRNGNAPHDKFVRSQHELRYSGRVRHRTRRCRLDHGGFHYNFHHADGFRSARVGHRVAEEWSEYYDEKCCGRRARRFLLLVVRIRAVLRTQQLHESIHSVRRLYGRSECGKPADGSNFHRVFLSIILRNNGDDNFIGNRGRAN